MDDDKDQKIAGLKGVLEQTAGAAALDKGAAVVIRNPATAGVVRGDPGEGAHLAPATDVDPATLKLTHALFEAAFLVAAADGQLTDVEAGRLADGIAELSGADVSDEELDRLIDYYTAVLERDGYDARLAAVGQSVAGSGENARAAFVFASGLAYCDGEVTREEEDTFYDLAAALQLSDADAEELLDQIEDAVNNPPA